MTVYCRNGWRRLKYNSQAPDGAVCFEIELVFRWTGGKLMWRRARIYPAENLKKKKVRVATTLLTDLPGEKEGNIESVLNCIDEAGIGEPDIICLSEGLYSRGSEDPGREVGGRNTQ